MKLSQSFYTTLNIYRLTFIVMLYHLLWIPFLPAIDADYKWYMPLGFLFRFTDESTKALVLSTTFWLLIMLFILTIRLMHIYQNNTKISIYSKSAGITTPPSLISLVNNIILSTLLLIVIVLMAKEFAIAGSFVRYDFVNLAGLGLIKLILPNSLEWLTPGIYWALIVTIFNKLAK